MTEFERKLLDLIREAMRQGNEPMQRRIIELEKNIHTRIDRNIEQQKALIKELAQRITLLEKVIEKQ